MSIVEATVKSRKGGCDFANRVAGGILFDGRRIKRDISYGALTVLLPKIFAMRYDASFP